jgi:hypothetical protein
MADPIADAAQKHPAPEGLVYQYGTAGVSREYIVLLDDGANAFAYSSARRRKIPSQQRRPGLTETMNMAQLTVTVRSSTR